MPNTRKESIWKQNPSIEFLNQLNSGTLVEALGIEFLEIGPDFIKARMPVDERTKQAMGLLHGGASAALSETLGSIGGTLCLKDLQKQMVVGIELNINHIRSARKGYVTGVATPIRLGSKIQVWQTDIKDDKDKITATSRLTIMVVTRE